MKYFEKDTAAGVLEYSVKEDGIALTGCRGRDVTIVIPEKVDFLGQELTVSEVGSKAFLSNKYLHEIELPYSVAIIDDWAFARCTKLETIVLNRKTKLGNGVFKDCPGLKKVYIRDIDPANAEDVGHLLAAAGVLLEDRFLFDLSAAGSAEWLENWDHRMDVILNTPDDEGFIALLACGEEDYEGRDNTLEGYLNQSRKRKVKICMVRLLHDYGLNEERRNRLIDYLRAHRAGEMYSLENYDNSGNYSDGYSGRTSISRDTESWMRNIPSDRPGTLKPMDEAWQVVLEEHGDEEEFYRLLMDCGCVDSDNLNLMLDDMGERHARMKAFLLRENSTKKASDFFDSLDL